MTKKIKIFSLYLKHILLLSGLSIIGCLLFLQFLYNLFLPFYVDQLKIEILQSMQTYQNTFMTDLLHNTKSNIETILQTDPFFQKATNSKLVIEKNYLLSHFIQNCKGSLEKDSELLICITQNTTSFEVPIKLGDNTLAHLNIDFSNQAARTWAPYLMTQRILIGFIIFLSILTLCFIYWFNKKIAKPLQSGDANKIPVQEIYDLTQIKQAQADLAAQVVHDIRSPLTSMIGACESLSNKEITEPVRTLQLSIERVQSILSKLSQKYHSQPHTKELPQLILIEDVLSQIILEARSILPKNIKLQITDIEKTRNLWCVWQVQEIKTAFSNLIRNAIEAIHNKGLIEIILTPEPSKINIIIQDNGKGIPENIIDKIFDKRFTYDKREGTGLGLSQVQNAIKWNDGSIRVQSEINKKTIFTISLPIEPTPQWATLNIHIPKNHKIIFYDDNQNILKQWKEKLSRLKVSSSFSEKLFIQNFKESVLVIDQFYQDDLDQTGLQFIRENQLFNNTYLCTDAYADPTIQAQVKTLGIQVIPKTLIHEVKILCES